MFSWGLGRIWMGELCRRRTCPAIGAVAKVGENNDCCGGGRGDGCGDGNR